MSADRVDGDFRPQIQLTEPRTEYDDGIPGEVFVLEIVKRRFLFWRNSPNGKAYTLLSAVIKHVDLDRVRVCAPVSIGGRQTTLEETAFNIAIFIEESECTAAKLQEINAEYEFLQKAS